MAQRESKIQATMSIQIVGRDAKARGQLELTPGNVHYYRPRAEDPTLSITYQQLTELLEREVAFREIDPDAAPKLGARVKNDFAIEVRNEDEIGEWDTTFAASCSVPRLDPRRLDLGSYQLSQDMASGQKRRREWTAWISIRLALWIVWRYVDKRLTAIKENKGHDEETPVTRGEMRTALMHLLRKLD